MTTKSKTSRDGNPGTKTEKFKIKWRKLLLEIAVILVVPVTVFLIRVVPEILAQPVYISNEAGKGNYRYALNYDYSKGADDNFEQKVLKDLKNGKIAPENQFYNMFALAIYYKGMGMYSVAIDKLIDLHNYATFPYQTKQIYRHLLDCYKALGMETEYELTNRQYLLYESYADDI